jgi:hypothetical protein
MTLPRTGQTGIQQHPSGVATRGFRPARVLIGTMSENFSKTPNVHPFRVVFLISADRGRSPKSAHDPETGPESCPSRNR